MDRKHHMLLVAGLFMLSIPHALAQLPHGFVQQETIKISGITVDSMIYPLSLSQKQTTRAYMDGMGRSLQTIGMQASPLQNDMIQPAAYDNLGRQTTGYLPYVGKSTDTMGAYRPNALTTDQPNFYNQTSQYLIPTDANPYAQQVFETSPLQRLQSAGMVGYNFQPVAGQHYKTVVQRFNQSTDGSIIIWNADGSVTGGNYYAVNTLSVTDAKDEDSTETQTFADAAGRLVLKRQLLSTGNLDTYYIYNMAGMPYYIVPPKALAIMVANSSYSLTQTGVNKLLFKFVYDTRGRLVEKTVPAKGVMYVVYDPLNRPVLTQDSSMRVNKKWAYIKYDIEGRPAISGTYVDVTYTTRSTMQTYVNGLSYSTWYESRSASGTTTGYYTNNKFPSNTTTTTPLSYAYYDDYDLLRNGAPFTYSSQGLPGEVGATAAAVKGAPTMSWKTTVGSGVSGTWLLKVTFFDKRGNPVQTKSNNHVYYLASNTITDYATSVPDFMGVPQISKVSKQSGASSTTTIQTNLTYDAMYRIKSVDQYYNGSTTVSHVAAYTYNEMGQVVQKSLGYVNSTTWLQNVDMRYSIRGQLLYINNSKLANDTGKTSSDTNDLFGMQLLYDKVDSKLSNTPSYSGRLTGVKWMSRDGSNTSSYERAFKYYYDKLGRDTAAIYAERTTTSTATFSVTNGWNENRITYDQNGNLRTLFRDSSVQNTGNHYPIDNLTYTYDPNNPNQLQTVTDGTTTQYKNSGFRNYTGSTGNYTYDGNGNLTTDPYKGLNLRYDVLNKTDTIYSTFNATNRFITYTYDASGNLIRKKVYDNNTLGNTTDYIDGFVYITASGGSATLQYCPMPEGRLLNSAGTLSQEFDITDQQGNVRLAFDNTGTGGTAKTRQENSYYAYGLIMPGTATATPTNDNKHLYNGGSEWQNDYSNNLPNYYQTYYRNYDAALGRWIGVDPMPESAESMTSYQYSGNNPIMFNDPLGDIGGSNPKLDGKYVYPQAPGDQGSNTNVLSTFQNRSDDFDAEDAMNAPDGIDIWAGSMDGLYYSNSTAYWNYYSATGGTLGGINVYNEGDGTASNPSSGSLRGAIGLANALLSGDGSSGFKSYYASNTGDVTIKAEGTYQNEIEVQDDNGGWHFLTPNANQGGDYFQVNRGLAPSNFNFQPSFGANWQAAGIKNVSILLYPEEEPVIFNLEVGLPTKSKYLGRTISRGEAQLASSKSYLQAMHMVNEEYSSGTISPISIPSHVASWMQFFLNQNLGGWHLATVTNILGTNPGAPIKFADYTLKQ